jgi:hypothetical protein
MKEIRIQINQGKLHYDLMIKDKYTLICGDSGSGKTALCDVLASFYTEYRMDPEDFDDSDILINNVAWKKSDIKIYYLDDNADHATFLQYRKGAVIVIDEFNSFLKRPNIKTKLDKCDNYFIIITRKCLNSLSIDVDSVYELVRISNNDEIINKLKPLRRFNDAILEYK